MLHDGFFAPFAQVNHDSAWSDLQASSFVALLAERARHARRLKAAVFFLNGLRHHGDVGLAVAVAIFKRAQLTARARCSTTALLSTVQQAAHSRAGVSRARKRGATVAVRADRLKGRAPRGSRSCS